MTKLFEKGGCQVSVSFGSGEVERFLVKQGFTLLTSLSEADVAKLAKPSKPKKAKKATTK